MKKKLQTIIATALVVVVAAVPVFAEVTGVMTSTSTTMTTEPVVDPDVPDVPEPEQKLPDYFIDLKDGLKAGTDYKGITVGVDMPVNREAKSEFILDGETYISLYVVQNPSANPKPNGGAVPTEGAYVKVSPTKDGTFTVVVNQTNEKDVYFVKDGATAEVVDTFKTVKNEVKVCSYEVKKGENYYFYASGSKIMIAGLGIKYSDDMPQPPVDDFVAVTDITGVATEMKAGETITLSGTVAPATATNKTIVWSVKSAGSTGATVSGDKLTATAAGQAVITATIANGKSKTEAFTKDFTITVAKDEPKPPVDDFVAVTDITGVATEMKAGETITLSGTVAPETATNQTIVWSVKDAGSTGATVSGDKLTATAAGQAVVTATIANGKSKTEAFTKDFTIEVLNVFAPGDVDHDGKLTVSDALWILMKLADKDTQGKYHEETAECDGKEGITVGDALWILMKLAGKL